MEKVFAGLRRGRFPWSWGPFRAPPVSNVFQIQRPQQTLAGGDGPAPARWLLRAGRRLPCFHLLSSARLSGMSREEFNPSRPTTDWKVAKKYLEKIDLAKRRSYYKTENFVVLDEIKTWKELAEEEMFTQPFSHYGKDDVMNQKLSILQEDITKLEINTIVNAANSSLMGGGGVDGAIHAGAGPLLQKECSTLGGCNTGDAKITSGYCLPAKYVIHTVGPIVQGKETLPEKALQSCYIKSLKLAEDNNLRTIAFPCISTGIYGYPNAQAAETVLKTVREFLEEHKNSFDRIIFCVFLDVDYNLYKQKMPIYFPFDVVPPDSLRGKSNTTDKN
ncbi:macro domain-containing protein CT2219-like isoform X1 [Hemiscyllium ocellatum]|uniref:macro domain-containing protein CT2219-like isoform X1 n=1 Tax=Hemiscyllium ocellatum TaxID=170820 RepID=UPI002966B21B|nr:macro domain-containing protein CT2219-like isoform X1 [Hemiscyllium ocellatum]